MQVSRQMIAAVMAGSVVTATLHGATYYVSPSGSDSSSGSLAKPYASLTKAVGVAAAGDTIYMRGGIYNVTSTVSIGTSKNGTAANPYKIMAYNGESPILDFSGVASGARGIQLNGNYWQIQGLTVRNAKDNGMHIQGSNNLIDRCVFTGNQDTGLQISGSSSQAPSNNLIRNCDSYANYDPLNHGENADGFAAKFRELGVGNAFNGCRAWGNSDDGWDFWAAANGVTLNNCWSFKNGFNNFADTAWAGDGNGFKLGHDSGPHVLQNILTWGNRLNGIDVNGNATVDTSVSSPYVAITHGVTINNVTAFNNGAGGNGANYNFDEYVAAFAHELQDNISFSQAGVGTSGTNGVNIYAGNINDHNTWNGIGVTAADFLSLDDTIAMGPRQADGSLPSSNFLHLAANSHLINAGVNVGLAYSGSAPDLGAFEVVPNPEPGTLAGVGVAGAILVMRRRSPQGVR